MIRARSSVRREVEALREGLLAEVAGKTERTQAGGGGGRAPHLAGMGCAGRGCGSLTSARERQRETLLP